jgi:hypothetical protein
LSTGCKDEEPREDEAIVLGAPYPWLKLFPFLAQVILAGSLKLAEQRQMEESQVS